MYLRISYLSFMARLIVQILCSTVRRLLENENVYSWWPINSNSKFSQWIDNIFFCVIVIVFNYLYVEIPKKQWILVWKTQFNFTNWLRILKKTKCCSCCAQDYSVYSQILWNQLPFSETVSNLILWSRWLILYFCIEEVLCILSLSHALKIWWYS